MLRVYYRCGWNGHIVNLESQVSLDTAGLKKRWPIHGSTNFNCWHLISSAVQQNQRCDRENNKGTRDVIKPNDFIEFRCLTDKRLLQPPQLTSDAPRPLLHCIGIHPLWTLATCILHKLFHLLPKLNVGGPLLNLHWLKFLDFLVGFYFK